MGINVTSHFTWFLRTVSSSDFEKYFRVGYFDTNENGNNWTGGSLVPVSVIDITGKWMYVSGSIKGYANSDPYKILTIGYTNYPDELRGNLSLIFGGIKMEKSESGTMFTP